MRFRALGSLPGLSRPRLCARWGAVAAAACVLRGWCWSWACRVSLRVLAASAAGAVPGSTLAGLLRSSLAGVILVCCFCCGWCCFWSVVCRVASLVVASVRLDVLRLCSCRGRSAGDHFNGGALRWADPAALMISAGVC